MELEGAQRFYAPEALSDIAEGLAWAQERSVGSTGEVWERAAWGRGEDGWSLLDLPEPVVHPGALPLLAEAAALPPDALSALLSGEVYLDEAHTPRLWPWYPEEDPEARPLAEARAAALGVALPAEHLDEPWEPAWYLRRTGGDAFVALMHAHGLEVPRIHRLPVPPRSSLPDVRYEGGLLAPSPAHQTLRALQQEVGRFVYVRSPEDRAYVLARVEHALARVFAALTGAPLPAGEPDPRELVASDPVADLDPSGDARLPASASDPSEAPRPGRVEGLYAVEEGVVLGAVDACLHVGPDGTLRDVFPGRLQFAAGHAAVVEQEGGPGIRDLRARRWCEGTVADHLHLLGPDLTQLPETAGHDLRRAPALSACGRYLLDTDETPWIKRFSDGLELGYVGFLEDDPDEDPDERRPPGPKPLLRPEDLATGEVTVLDGVRFTVRAGEPPVAPGRSLAFALAGDQWRFITGDRVLDGDRERARLGIRAQSAALTAGGETAWILGEDHLIRLDLEPRPRVASIWPVAPLLEGL